MVRLSLLPLLAALSGAVLAVSIPEQLVLGDADTQLAPKWSYTTCGAGDGLIDIHSIELTPDPPKPGSELTVKVFGTASDTIEEGAYAKVTVKIGLIKLLTKEFDICKEARSANVTLQCPVEKGDHEVSHTVKLPREIPPAKFTVNVDAFTVDDEDLFCLNLDVDFRLFPFPSIW